MTAALATTLPGSRTLHGWWRDLAPRSPRRLWFAHLPLHRVEALVEADTSALLPLLAPTLLSRLASSPCSAATFAADLALDPALTRDLLDELARQGLVECGGDDLPRLSATAAGGARPATTLHQRRTFYFLDERPPCYLPLPAGAAAPLDPAGAWHFDRGTLRHCVGQSDEWKRQTGFPLDVRCVLEPADLAADESWCGVVVDQAEQLPLLLAEMADGGLQGMAVQTDGWLLPAGSLFQLPAGGLPGDLLTIEPEGWRQAWHGWCLQRGLPGGEADACQLEPIDHRLRVTAPGRLIERLRQARSDALRGEAWLLAGSGRFRAAALIELIGA